MVHKLQVTRNCRVLVGRCEIFTHPMILDRLHCQTGSGFVKFYNAVWASRMPESDFRPENLQRQCWLDVKPMYCRHPFLKWSDRLRRQTWSGLVKPLDALWDHQAGAMPDRLKWIFPTVEVHLLWQIKWPDTYAYTLNHLLLVVSDESDFLPIREHNCQQHNRSTYPISSEWFSPSPFILIV